MKLALVSVIDTRDGKIVCCGFLNDWHSFIAPTYCLQNMSMLTVEIKENPNGQSNIWKSYSNGNIAIAIVSIISIFIKY